MSNIKTSVCADSIHIQARNLDFNDVYNNLLDKNDWHYERTSNKDNANEYRVYDSSQRTLFHINVTNSRFYKQKDKFREQSLLFKFEGLVSHRKYKDKRKEEAQLKVVEYLQEHNNYSEYLEYLKIQDEWGTKLITDNSIGINSIDIAFDIELKTTNIDNFFAMKTGAQTKIVNPLYCFYGKDGSKTFYIESTKKPNLKAYFYEKHRKEKLSKKTPIYRFEVKFSKLYKISRDPELIINHIEKQLKLYKLFHFSDVNQCDQYKKEYAKNIPIDKALNITETGLQEVKASSNEIKLELSDDIKNYIYNLFKTPEKPVVETNELINDDCQQRLDSLLIRHLHLQPELKKYLINNLPYTFIQSTKDPPILCKNIKVGINNNKELNEVRI